MSMEKHSTEHLPCTYCEKDALEGTNPPVCADHLLNQQASEEEKPATLKELEAQD